MHATSSNTGRCDFKRYVAPNQVRVAGLPVNTDLPAALDQLDLRRPLLGYPAVVYIGGYADPLSAHVRQADNQESHNVLLDERPLDPRV